MNQSEIEPEKFLKFATKIGIKFNDLVLLQTALTHRSYLNESNNSGMEHNERLEFLGDAVLELIVTEFLFHTYPDKPEGELTSYRAAAVRTESIASVSLELGVGKYLLVSKGEEMTGGRKKPYLLANTFEAILGAIYLDQGYEEAKKFVGTFLIPKISTIVKFRLDIDSKSRLQELSQEILGITPRYELAKAEGPDHDKEFTMRILLEDKSFGEGTGKSKQEAEQKAAEYALANWDDQLKKYNLLK